MAVNMKGDSRAAKLAILMPGRLDTKDYINFTSHADYLAKKDYFVVAIDPPGTWESPGDLEAYTTSTYLKVVNELIDHLGNRPTLLLGHSRGGATAMLASVNPAVSALVVVNAAYGRPSAPDPEKITNGRLRESRDLPPGDTRTEEQKLFSLPLAYFEDGVKHDPQKALEQFKGPKLVIHANKDEFVTMDRVKKIYDNLTEPKRFLAIDSTHDYRLYPEAIKSVEVALGNFLEIL